MNEGDDGSDPGESVRFEALLRRAARLPAVQAPGTARVRVGALLCGERFQVLRRLGEGGMGMVFEAFDHTRGVSVALKTVSQLDAGAIYRLKNEFRSLSEVLHPNLVQLYELFADEGQWLFSMELVEGVPFDAWTRPGGALDLARLRAALRQLIAGVRTIHAAGKLHRDLKPSNMLVTPAGRVVILDFGLAADPEPGGAGQTSDAGHTIGTPAYMAPEQAAALDSLTASDWYAVGVIVFEALTGALPFDGKPGAILVDKQLGPAPRASTRSPLVPPDLDALCAALLERDPAARPTGDQLEAWFGGAERTTDQPVRRSSTTPSAAQLIGRERELEQLRDAYARAARGQATVAHVAGESGVGKSTLCGAFLQELRETQPAVLLSGRCYERESVPYKALDRMVDELSRYLQQLPAVEAAELMPRAVAALARVFPVLERVACVASAPLPASNDEQELRKLAFEAFAELLARIRDRRPLVLYLDDLQWTDQDSALLLERLFAAPGCPPLLLIASHRAVPAGDNAALAHMLRALGEQRRVGLVELPLAPLPLASATELARKLLPDATRAAEVAREAGGNPFFVGELCRYVLEAAADGERPLVALEHALERRVVRAGSQAVRLLALLAISGRPTPATVLAAACESGVDVHAELHQLRGAQLVRASGERGFECYHDRIREALVARLGAEERRELHASLARAWEAGGDADPEVLFEHRLSAGDTARAAEHAVQAAHKALGSLAFEHGAELYRRAIALSSPADVAARGLEEHLGEALSRAGRWAEAGAAFARAAEHAGASANAIELENRAAMHLLGSGRYDQGLPRLLRLFRLHGLPWPRTSWGAALGAAMRLVWLRFTAERALRRELAPAPAGTAAIGAGKNLGTSTLAMQVLMTGAGLIPPYDTLRGLYLVATFALRGLRSGQRVEAAIAVGMLASLMASWRATRSFGQRLATRALELLDGDTPPDVAAAVFGFAGFARMLDLRLEEARALGARGTERLHGVSRTYAYQSWGARNVQSYALTVMGRVGDAAKLFAATEHEARELGDELAAVGGSSVYRYMVEDDIAGGEKLLAQKDAFLARVPSTGVLHPMVGIERAIFFLYCGRGASALELQPIEELGGFTQLQPLALGAACALQAIDQGGVRPELVQRVRRAQRRVPRGGDASIAGLRAHLDGALAAIAGNRAAALADIERAVGHYERAGMALHAAALRMRMGQLRADAAGAELVADAERFMRAQGIVNVPAWADFLAPGFARLLGA